MDKSFMEILEEEKKEGAPATAFMYRGKKYFVALDWSFRIFPEFAYYVYLPKNQPVNINLTKAEDIIQLANIIKYGEDHFRVCSVESDLKLMVNNVLEIQRHNAEKRLKRSISTEDNDTILKSLLDKMVTDENKVMQLLLEKAMAFARLKHGNRMFERISPTNIEENGLKIRFGLLFVEDGNAPGKWRRIPNLLVDKYELEWTTDIALNGIIIGQRNEELFNAIDKAAEDIAMYGCEDILIKLL